MFDNFSGDERRQTITPIDVSFEAGGPTFSRFIIWRARRVGRAHVNKFLRSDRFQTILHDDERLVLIVPFTQTTYQFDMCQLMSKFFRARTLFIDIGLDKGSTEKCCIERKALIHALSRQKWSNDWKFHFRSSVSIVHSDRECSTKRWGSTAIDRASMIELLSPWFLTVTISRLLWKRDQYEGFDSSHIRVDSSTMVFGSRRKMFSSSARAEWNSSEGGSCVVPTLDREISSIRWQKDAALPECIGSCNWKGLVPTDWTGVLDW